MNKLLHNLVLLAFTVISVVGYSQSNTPHDHSDKENDDTILVQNSFTVKNVNEILKSKHFSYKYNMSTENDHHLTDDHDHNHDITLIDIISSDVRTDFNCSGGFCMNKSHYHKKGLTLMRQFFGYFMKITC